MSISFSNTTEYNGMIQFFETEIGADYGYISGNTTKLKEVTALMNLARRKYFSIAVQLGGTWELDDNLHSDYHIIYTTIESGRRDYPFITDENGNVIRDIYKVLILPTATSTVYQELDPIDENQSENLAFIDGANTPGTPTKYAKRGNAIFLGGAVPNYTVSRGLKVLINREPSYYVYNDDVKKFGFPYHPEYCFLESARNYARRKGLAVLPKLEEEVLKLEGNPLNGVVGFIAKAYGNRKKDEIDVISGECINSI